MEGKQVITSCRKNGCSRPLVPIILWDSIFVDESSSDINFHGLAN